MDGLYKADFVRNWGRSSVNIVVFLHLPRLYYFSNDNL